jgi:hypothetical protein
VRESEAAMKHGEHTHRDREPDRSVQQQDRREADESLVPLHWRPIPRHCEQGVDPEGIGEHR